MKKGIEKTGRMLLICLCMGLSISCTSGQGTEDVSWSRTRGTRGTQRGGSHPHKHSRTQGRSIFS